jgi:LAS superfamily LD-carboxypeptidase LdcB
MRSSVRHARGALLATATASLLGLSPVASASDGDMSAATTLTETVAAIDPTTAPGDKVVTTLEHVDQLVAGLAEQASTAADEEAEAASGLADAQAAVDELESQVDGDAEPAPGADTASVAPPSGVLDALSGRALSPSTGRLALADWQGSVGRSSAAAPPQVELAAARRAEDEAAARVEAEAAEADEAAAALADAQARGDEFVATVEDRVSTNLSEADGAARRNADQAEAVRTEEEAIATTLDEIAAARDRWEAAAPAEESAPGRGEAEAAVRDKAAADKAAAEQRAAAEKAAAEQAAAEQAAAARQAALNAPLPDPTGSASGALAGPWCADGRRIVVDSSLGGAIQALINDAAANGVGICAKSAFRPATEQIALRRQNCGSSAYAIYDAPPSTCSPPTARPGTSNHEDGLAVDFSCDDGQPMTHASPCFRWLAAHGASYGMFNLPSEPWHWSVTGS